MLALAPASRGLALLALVCTGARLVTRDTPAANGKLVVFGTASTSPQHKASRALLGQPLPSPSLATVAGPTDSSNWLVPGRLIIGAKPTVVDAQALMAAGVCTFCSLIGEWSPEHYREREYPAGLAATSLIDATFLYFGIEDFGVPQPDELETLVLELRRRLLLGEVIYIHCHGGHGRTGTVAIPLLVSIFGAATEAVEAYINRVTREGRPTDRERIRRGGHVELPETSEQRRIAQLVSGRLKHLAVAGRRPG